MHVFMGVTNSFQENFDQCGYRKVTFKGENAKVTMALEPKFVRTARLIPLPLVRSGKISDTISQLIGPNEIWLTRKKRQLRKVRLSSEAS